MLDENILKGGKVGILRVGRSAGWIPCLALVLLSCQPPSSGPRAAMGSTWVGCSDTQRDAVGGGTTLVQICAERDARFYIGSNAGSGATVARIVNVGPAVEKRWELEVGREYFVIITPGGSGPGGQFRIVGPGNGHNPKRVGNYYQCPPLHARPDSSSARFGLCTDTVTSAGTHPVEVGSADQPAPTVLAPSDGPAWISCETGCCTTEAQ